MNYMDHYNKLIDKARNRPPPEGYYERHHVIPKALGGSNKKENLVSLTAREHFVAHLLLAKIHGGTMWVAVYMMRGLQNNTGRKYEWVKKRQSESMKGEGNSFYGKSHTPESLAKMTRYGYKHSEETKKHFSESRRGSNNGMYGRTQSPETRAKIAAKKQGLKMSEEIRARHSKARSGKGNPRYGVKLSDETKEKIRQKALERNAVKRKEQNEKRT